VSDGSFSATGIGLNDSKTWTATGTVSDSNINFRVDYDINDYFVVVDGTIAPDGSMSGTAVSGSSQSFSWSTTSGYAMFNRNAMITAPEEHEFIWGNVTFEAYLVDNDKDTVQWAVREGTCIAGQGTVWGNVDSHNNPYTWTYDTETYIHNFSSTADTSGWTPGMYCFVFNPKEGAGEDESDIRLTREFYVADWGVYGGGQIIEETDSKPKNDFKISFGGWAYDVGSSHMGEWEVNFHNVDDDIYDKSKFRGTDITNMNWYTPTSNTCTSAMNLTVNGEWNGNPGYKLVMRAGDNGAPGKGDTVRFELWNGGIRVYDTSLDGDFPNDSSCRGTNRTYLDHGNLTIVN
jgi:hypothetical protein